MPANKQNIILRTTKGSPLTHAELDANLTEIKNVIDDVVGLEQSKSATKRANSIVVSDANGELDDS